MLSAWSDSVRWNIFARELESVLDAHDLRLGHLDDRGVVLHPEKVRRLQQSLDTPSHFPVLNPDEIDRLFATVRLTTVEQCRIRAALLATAVERVLMDRLEPEAALMAANDVYEICLAVMREEPERTLNAAVRTGVSRGGGDASDTLFADALNLIDEATLALHGANDALTQQAKSEYARMAETTFARALTVLQAIEAPPDLWSKREAYLTEAREGKTSAEALLRSEVK